MIRAARRLVFDPGLFAALWAAALAMWPVLTRAGLPQSTDATAHIYRTFEVLDAWRAGVLYPRWTHDFIFGFGYPIFHYYAPLAYYLGAAYSWLLAGGDPVVGIKFVIVIGAGAGALGMYLFARDLWQSAPAGVVSAAAFALSPYFIFNGSLIRGAVPETLAVGIAPWFFWTFLRLGRAPTRRRLALAALALAGLILAHNLMSIVFVGLWAAWFCWDIALSRDGGAAGGRQWLAPLAAAALGLALSAFMWLPAALERDAVQYQRAGQWLAVTADDLFSLPRMLRALSSDDLLDQFGQGTTRSTLGVVQAALGVLGGLALWPPKTKRAAILFWLLATLGLVLILNPASLPIWQSISLSGFLQFPERLFGVLAFTLAMLAGAAVDGLAHWLKPLPMRLIAALSAAACAAGALTMLDPPPWPAFPAVTHQELFRMEDGLGFTTGEFLPVGVLTQLRARPSLLDSYSTGLVDKVDREALPADAQVTVLSHGPDQDRFHVTAGSAFTLHVLTLYWPGWTAYVNGAPTPVQTASPEGFIGVHVPAGESDVWLRLQDTPPRTLGWAISALAALTCAGLALWPRAASHPNLAWPRLERLDTLAALGLLALMVAARLVLDRDHWWLKPWPGQPIPGAQPQLTSLEHNVDFLGYHLNQTTARPGSELPLTLYWRARAPVPLNLRVFVHLIGPDGQLWGQSDKLRPGGLGAWDSGVPTSRWPLDRYFTDPHTALIRPDAPTGQYQIVAGLWADVTGARARVVDASGLPTEQDGVVLGTSLMIQP